MVSSSVEEEFHAAQSFAENQLFAFQERMKSQGKLVRAEDLTRQSCALEEFGPLSFFGEFYSEIRSYLPVEERAVYDSVYIPFVAPWVEGFSEPYPPVNDFHDSTGLLAKHGMGWILSSERCANMAASFTKHSFSRLIHLLFARGRDLPPAAGSTLFFHQMLSTKLDHLHSTFTEMTEGWRILTAEARNRKWGMLIVG